MTDGSTSSTHFYHKDEANSIEILQDISIAWLIYQITLYLKILTFITTYKYLSLRL